MAMANKLGFSSAIVDASELAYLRWSEERSVRNFAKIIWNKPDALICGHPAEVIEAREIYRLRVTAQGALPARIEVDVQVTHRELAQRAVNRFTIATADVVRSRDCAPATRHFEEREHMVRVIIRFQIPD